MSTDDTRTHEPSDWQARRAAGREWAYNKPNEVLKELYRKGKAATRDSDQPSILETLASLVNSRRSAQEIISGLEAKGIALVRTQEIGQ